MKMIKLAMIMAGLSLFLPLTSAQAGSRDSGCRIKEENLERKLEYARSANNHWQVAGLEKALDEVRRNCTEPRLKARNESKIRDKQEKVREREAELAEARAKGDPQKIAKRERKLREARAELEEAQAGHY